MDAKIPGQWNSRLYEDMQPGYIGPRPPGIGGSGVSGILPPQPVYHDLEVLEKVVESLRDSLRELNGRLDSVLNPEWPQCGSSLAKSASTSCPLAERIQRITESVQDIAASVASTRNRLAL